MKQASKKLLHPSESLSAPPARGYSTDQFAALMHVRPNTLRHAVCIHGHYYGVRPNKLPNGFLDWPAEAVDALTRKN